jgi:hypothetical protein
MVSRQYLFSVVLSMVSCDGRCELTFIIELGLDLTVCLILETSYYTIWLFVNDGKCV